MSAAWPLLEAKRTWPGLTAREAATAQNTEHDAEGARGAVFDSDHEASHVTSPVASNVAAVLASLLADLPKRRVKKRT
jgi:hypothetical protein